ncbi:MAG: hypothetical protein ACHQIL_03585 [Steroidobacterales bacterium]
MAVPAGRPGMPGVMPALVLDEQFLRREVLRQDLAQARLTRLAVQGST